MLACKETAVTFPIAILLANSFFPAKPLPKRGRRGIGLYIALLALLVIYLIFWISIQYRPGIGQEHGYGLTINPLAITTNFFTYLVQVFIGNAILFSLLLSFADGSPREFATSFMHSPIGYILGIVGIAVVVLLFIWIGRRWGKFHSHERRYAAFGFIWFILCLLPVLPFPGHNTAYYLNIAMIGFSSCIAGIALGMRDTWGAKGGGRAVGWILLGLYLLNFAVNTLLGASVTRAALRSPVGKQALEWMIQRHPSFEQGTLLFIIDIDEELRFTLNDGLIYMAWYDDNLRWVFTIKEDQTITWAYLDVHGWSEGGPRIYYSYDGNEFTPRTEEYFLGKYGPVG
jgi:hypothetical protein